MQCLSNKFCWCCNTEVDESGNELTNNDSIKTNSAMKIQRAFRVFKNLQQRRRKVKTFQ